MENRNLNTDSLRFVSAVTVPKTRGKFNVKNTFTAKAAGIEHISIYFQSWFFSASGFTEPPHDEQTLAYYQVSKIATSGQLIEQLGGSEKVRTYLSQMFFLMEMQGGGKDGILLTNGASNLFYVRGFQNFLFATEVRWLKVGWGLHADLITNTAVVKPHSQWPEGTQVFSPEPSPPLSN